MNAPQTAEKFANTDLHGLLSKRQEQALAELLQATWDQSAKSQATKIWIEDSLDINDWLTPMTFDVTFPETPSSEEKK